MYTERYVHVVSDVTDDWDVIVEQPVPIVYDEGDVLVHSVDSTGRVVHDERYPDETCPCHEDEVNG